MIGGKIWKAGNSYVVTIPRDEMEARGLHVGQMVGIEPIPLELRPVDPRTPEQRAAGWKTQDEVDRVLEKSVERDIIAGSLTQDEIEQAEQDIDQGAEWVRQL
jgi:antitoxin component of MazEF toxin-antitoxin module